MAKDLYDVLGVSRTATQDEIRKAYLKLAHKYHPDKTGGDTTAEEKLKEVNAAYDVLKNADKRKQYDTFGSTDGMGGAGGFSGFGGGQGFEQPFDDFFDMLFGQGGGGRRRGGGGGAQPGHDLELRLRVTLAEAAAGTKKTVRFSRMEPCSTCNGTGAEPGSSPEVCKDCEGTGQVRMSHGFFSVSRTCPRCQGAGKIISKPCRRCSGSGKTQTSRELGIDVPAGVDTGSRLRIAGEGEPGGPGSPRGDLYIFIEVLQHDHFERDGTTILCEVPISFTQAALGDTIRVPTLDSEADLKIPPGSQTGTQFRLRGLGLPDLRGYRKGDMIVRILVETPTKLSKKQKELLQEFQELSDPGTYPLYKRFLDAFKQ